MMGAPQYREVGPDGTILRDEQYELIEWLLDPHREGTQKKWAEDHKIDPSTIYRWKKDRAFKEVWEQRASEVEASPERVHDIVANLARLAGGNGPNAVSAAKLYLEYTKRFTPTTTTIVEDKTAKGLSDEELATELEQGARRLRAV